MALTPAHHAELLRLAALSTEPAVRAFLESAAAPLSAPAPLPAAPAGAPAPAPLRSALAPAPAAGSEVTWIEPRHAWEQDNEYVTILALDLPPFATKEAKAAVSCTISADAVELTVPPHFRLRLFPLEKPVNVAESSFKVKKTQVEVRLRKKEQWEHWPQLLAKQKRDALKDPTAGIQDLLRDSACAARRKGGAAAARGAGAGARRQGGAHHFSSRALTLSRSLSPIPPPLPQCTMTATPP
jgi:hypothetical protein